jgi:hypothetical protein
MFRHDGIEHSARPDALMGRMRPDIVVVASPGLDEDTNLSEGEEDFFVQACHSMRVIFPFQHSAGDSVPLSLTIVDGRSLAAISASSSRNPLAADGRVDDQRQSLTG